MPVDHERLILASPQREFACLENVNSTTFSKFHVVAYASDSWDTETDGTLHLKA